MTITINYEPRTQPSSQHYVVYRVEHGQCSGPGTGVAYPDEYQVMAASRSLRGARRAQSRLGGMVACVDQPMRRYGVNEELTASFRHDHVVSTPTQARKAAHFARRLQRFFTAEERQALEEI